MWIGSDACNSNKGSKANPGSHTHGALAWQRVRRPPARELWLPVKSSYHWFTTLHGQHAPCYWSPWCRSPMVHIRSVTDLFNFLKLFPHFDFIQKWNFDTDRSKEIF